MPGSPWFEDNFTDETDEEEEELLSECVCSECNGTFFLAENESVTHCPLCNTFFDKPPQGE